jgi:uncharacterized protein (DUF983 family)
VAPQHSADGLLEKVTSVFGNTMCKERITTFWALGAAVWLHFWMEFPATILAMATSLTVVAGHMRVIRLTRISSLSMCIEG